MFCEVKIYCHLEIFLVGQMVDKITGILVYNWLIAQAEKLERSYSLS